MGGNHIVFVPHALRFAERRAFPLLETLASDAQTILSNLI